MSVPSVYSRRRKTAPLWLASIALVGAALLGCRNATRPTPAKTTSSAADPFIDATEQSGIRWVNRPAKRPMRLLESVGFGGGFLDYDGDGFLDVLLIGAPRSALYRNRRDGSFEDVSKAAGLAGVGNWIGCAVGDYDNDGAPDIYVTGYQRSALYRNRKDGTFQNVTATAGVAMLGRWSTAATFADFDRDGLLDLYVGTYCQFGPNSRQYCVLHQNGVKTGCRPIDYEPEIGHCFRNRGKGVFQDVTKAWGLDRAHGKTLGAAAADYDADGWPDLYLANDEMQGDLFHNEKGRRFTNVAVETGTAFGEQGKLMGGMGVDWGDYDNDGWLDLAIGTFESEAKVLFHSLQGRSFEFDSASAGILSQTYADVVFGTLLFDYDNDGWLDLLFTNGHTMDNISQIRPTIPYRQPTRLFRNRNARFELAPSATLDVPIAGRAVACGDYRNDGTLGLLLMDMDGRVRLLKNEGAPGHHWLEVRTRGRKSNRDGLGARITLGLGSTRRIAEVVSSRSYLSTCDRRVHFGLGSADRVDRLEVRWPSGRVSVLKDVNVDRVVEVLEGE